MNSRLFSIVAGKVNFSQFKQRMCTFPLFLDFATIVSHGKFIKLLKTGSSSSRIKFQVSVLAESVEFLLAASEKWQGEAGIVFTLDKASKNNNNGSQLFKCNALRENGLHENCITFDFEVKK